MRFASPFFLVNALVIPLLALTACTLWASGHVREPWTGLLVNLAAGFVGTVMTVVYIDVVLRRHESAQWQDVGKRVAVRVERLANVIISSIRTGLELGTDMLDLSTGVGSDTTKRRQMMIAAVESAIIPEVHRIEELDVKRWRLLITNLQEASLYADQLLGHFSLRLDAAMTGGVLNLQDLVGDILASYSTFPDIFGVPIESLPRKKDGSSSTPLQLGLYANAENTMIQLLSVSAGLLRKLEAGPPVKVR